MPIMLTFDHPITDKAAVERALTLTTSKPVIGAWYWDGSEQLDFRPRDYWPADTTVSFSSHLDGVEGAPGVYGVHDLAQTFNIGQSVIAVANTSTFHTQIYVDGKLKYTWPISTGKSVTPTPNGTYLTVEKANPVRMIGGKKGTPGYYNELVNWAVRFTFSGDYYHSAPWSVVNQGESNVSHGCVNLAPEDAQTYYNMAIPGDPITITSSPKAGNWDDGWTAVVPVLVAVPSGQRHPHGGRGRPERQHPREPVRPPGGHRDGPPGHVGRRQLRRRLVTPGLPL